MSEKPTKPWHVERTSVYGANGVLVCTFGGYTVDADSALVSAAPELLQACEMALNDRMYREWPAIADALMAAITKAGGQV